MIWNQSMETVSRSQTREFAARKAQVAGKLLVTERIPFYHKRMDEAGVKPEKFKQLSDIQYIPYTVKEDLRDNYPFGLFARAA